MDEGQNMDDMVKNWGELVDQITFVKYNPGKYLESPLSEVNNHCSDLWRRIFMV